MLLAIIIPVYNEAPTLARLIARIDAVPPPRHGGQPLTRRLIIIDDGSTDGTTEILRELAAREDVHAIFQPRNRGKGAALREGFRAALERGADLVLIQDGDLEYDPADHATALQPILDGRADAVIGSRFIGQSHRVIYYWHRIANLIITQLCNMMTNLNLTDIECGTKAFTRRVAEQLTLEEDRFGVEPEIIARLASMRITDDLRGPESTGAAAWTASSPAGSAGAARPRRLRIYEVPVSYAGRTYEEGKKIGWQDGFSALRAIVKYTLLAAPPFPHSRSSPGVDRAGPGPRPTESTT